MKQLWLKWVAKIDALSLRERALVAVAGVAAIVFIVYMGVIDPANVRERALRDGIVQQRAQIAAIDAEVAQKEAAAKADPDAALRVRLALLKADNEKRRAALRNTQAGLVPPANMSKLLNQMVQQNGKLRLVSLKTLPPAGTTDGNFAVTADEAGGPVAPAGVLSKILPGTEKPQPLLYRHGVEVVLQGSYGDMVAYMEALERMPAQVFWGRAVLDATEHDKTTLALTLYTLSLDEKWIAL